MHRTRCVAMKIAFIGAGSAKFVRVIVTNLLAMPAMADAHLALMDVDAARLEKTAALLGRMVRERGASLQLETTTDQRRAVDGAAYVIITVMVGGLTHYATDTFIPERHGLSLAVGDSSGPGAVFRLIRTAPVIRELAGNLARYAPQALVLNYANPMAMLTRMYLACGHERVIGLCHSLRSSVDVLAQWLDLPAAEIEYRAGGLNHIDFYLTLRHQGRDLYPALRAKAEHIIRTATAWEADTWRHEARGYERIRFELLERLGYFPAEGPWHQGDFYPWFRRTPELVAHYGPPTGWAYHFDRLLGAHNSRQVDRMIAGEEPLDYTPRPEEGSLIIAALATGAPCRLHLNVRNEDLITNLPADAVVEVPCRIDADGVTPERVGSLPPQLAAVMQPHARAHDLAVNGVLRRSRELIRSAIAADPLTQAALTPAQIVAMADELMDANRQYLQEWR